MDNNLRRLGSKATSNVKLTDAIDLLKRKHDRQTIRMYLYYVNMVNMLNH